MSVRSLKRARRRDRQKQLRRAQRLALAGAAVGSALLAAPSAQAANFEVNDITDGGDDTCDATCTLRDAVDDANNAAGGDTITFESGLTGEITLTDGDLYIEGDQNLTITGPGAETISVSGDANNDDVADFANSLYAGDSRIFDVFGNNGAATEAVAVSGLTLKEGVASSYEFRYGYDYYEAEDGGAIRSSGVDLTISDSTLTDNLASGRGGAVAVASYGTTVTIDDSTITGNRSYDDGGGLRLTDYGYSAPTSVISDSTISYNDAGGGAELFGSSYPEGGGAALGGAPTLSNVTISDNTASAENYTNTVGDAGGLSLSSYLDATPASTDLTITNNFAGDDVGGALFEGDGIRVLGATIAGNGAGDDAGGAMLHAEAELRTAAISFNAAAVGGGVDIQDQGRLVDSTVTDNEAVLGAGVSGYSYGLSSGGRIVNSTISGNDASLRGGGVYGGSPNGIALRNSTVARNSAQDGGGVFGYAPEDVSSDDAPVSVVSSIVADNTATLGGADADGDIDDSTDKDTVAASFSLIENAAVGSVTESLAGSNVFGTDPGLGLLADNGGPTETHLPANSSPVIDAAVAGGLTADQRGQDRTVDTAAANEALSDGTDMGAVEVQNAAAPGDPYPETTITSGPTGTQTATTASFAFSSNVSGATFECSLDGGAWTACTSPKQYTGLSTGAHSFQVRATDTAGNTDASPASRQFIVDPTGGGSGDDVAPDTQITNDPPAKVKAKKKKGKITFEFTGSDDQTAKGDLTFECSLDGAKFAACTSPLTVKAKKGDHLFQVRAVDEAGNVDRDPASHRFTVKKKKKKK